MLEKARTGLNLFILFMFVFAIIYGLIVIIYKSFNADSIYNVNYVNEQNVDIYLTNENLVKTDYTTFFALERCVQDIITSLNEGRENDVYNILISDLKKKVGKSSTLVEYYNNNFKYEVSKDMYISGYQNSDNLKQAYKIDGDTYICVVTSMNDLKSTKIGIKLINNDSYLISYIEL